MYLKLKQNLFFFILIWQFPNVLQKFERAPIMLLFRCIFTETQTTSLIIFGARQVKKFLKDNRHSSHKDFLFIAVEKERRFFTVVSKMKKVNSEA